MATTVADLEVVITSDTTQAESGINSFSGKLRNLSGAQLAALGAGFTALGGAIASIFTGSIGVASEFNAQLSAIASVGGADAQAAMGRIRDTALELGYTTAFSASEAAAAMAELIKAGMGVGDVLNGGAQAALDLAAATGTEVPKSAELIAITMAQMGIDATKAANIIAQVTNAAAMDVTDFAYSMKTAAVQAAALGIPIEDLAAVFGVLSNAGIKGEQAGTAVRNMLLGLANPSTEAKNALNELGVTVFDSSGNFVGMEAVLGDLQAAFASMTPQQRLVYSELIAGKDAAAAFLTLIEGGPAALQQMTAAMGNAGTASEQASQRTNNFKGAMDELNGAIETAQIMIGSRLLPVLQTIVGHITSVVAAFLNLNPQVQNAILIFTAVIGMLSLLGAGFIAAQLAATLLGGSMLAVLGPIALVIAAVAALAAGFYYAYSTNLFGFRDGVQSVIAKLQELWSVVQLAATQIFTTLSTYWTQAQAITERVWGVIGGTVTTAIQLAVTIATTYITTLIRIITIAFTTIWDVISNVVQMVVAIFKGDWGAAKDHAIAAVQALMTGVIGIYRAIFSGLVTILGAIKDAIVKEFSGAASSAITTVTNLGTSVVNAFTNLVTNIISKMAVVKNLIVSGFDTAKESAITAVNNLVTSAVSAIAGMATSLFNGAWNAGWNVGQGLIDGIASIWGSVVNFASSLASAVYNTIRGALDIFSPSKMTAYLGEMVGQGLIVGMKATVPDVERSSLNLAQAAMPVTINQPAYAAPRASSGTVVHQTYQVTLSISEFEELTEAIEFVQGLSNSTERQLIFAR